MTVTRKMIHYLLLLRSLERSGMNRREEANTPATLTATERGASTWHLFLFIGLSVYRFVCSATPTAVSSVEVCVSALARLGWLAHEPLAQRHTRKGSVVVKSGDCDNGDNCLNVLRSMRSHRGTSDDESKC